MAKLTLNDLASLSNEVSALAELNANFALIETAFENTFSRDGTSPNTFQANVDANNYRIYNLLTPVSSGDAVNKDYVDNVASIGIAGPIGATGPQGNTGSTGSTGSTGAAGDTGWAPVFNIVSDSSRRVLQLNDWTGGTGTKPGHTGEYVSASGFTATIGNGVDIRGPTGAAGAGTGDMVAANNLSDVSSTTTSRANLGLIIGTNVQAFDTELAAIAGLVSAADRLPYFTGSGTASLATFTTAGRALIDDADATAQRTTLGLGTIATQASSNVTITGGAISGITDLPVADGGTGASTAANARTNLGLVIGTNVQAYNALLADIAGITFAQGDVLYYNGTNLVHLAPGTSGQFLKTQGAGANPVWATASAGSTGDIQTFTSSGTWTKPALSANALVIVSVWGTGGGGGRGTTSASTAGGQGGSFAEYSFQLSDLGATETVTIGAGGLGRTASSGDGLQGGTTSFGSWVSVTGAYGGTGSGTYADIPAILAPVTRYDSSLSVITLTNRAYAGGNGGRNVTAGETGALSTFGGDGGTGGTSPTAGTQPSGGGGAGKSVDAGNGAKGKVIVKVLPF